MSMHVRPSLSAAKAAPVFAALGDEMRLKLVARLADGKAKSIVALTEGTGLTRQGVTKHLAVLESANVAVSRRVGRQTLYVVQPGTLRGAQDYLERAARQWDDAIERLRRLVET
jgi:DNA-binding transcriptional ArsR family regulator